MKKKAAMTEEMRVLAEGMGLIAHADPNLRCNHTPNQPEGYLQWHSWAEEMSKRHTQIQCELCGLWSVWVPKASK